MIPHHRPISILIAEDDLDDQLLIREALDESRLLNEITFVQDGEELLEYVRRCGQYASDSRAGPPDLILLDLNMPRKDGRQTLRELKSDPALRSIPVVILTTSKQEEDITRMYDLGANSFIVKPVTFRALVEMVQVVTQYWFSIVQLPPAKSGARSNGTPQHEPDRRSDRG